jgi:uncharacterized protein (TIGR02391 family)
MTEEEIIRKDVSAALGRIDNTSVRNDAKTVVNRIKQSLSAYHSPASRANYLTETIQQVQAQLEGHKLTCARPTDCPIESNMQEMLFFLQQEAQVLPQVEGDQKQVKATFQPSPSLSTLHPAIQQAAGSRFTTAHYSDAIQKACTALEKAVQAKAQQPANVTGASLMTTAFSKNNALIQLSTDPNEQFGFMSLYQGTVLALRNHYAHNLTELTDPSRALEWLGFISALFYKLDEAQPTVITPVPDSPGQVGPAA